MIYDNAPSGETSTLSERTTGSTATGSTASRTVRGVLLWVPG